MNVFQAIAIGIGAALVPPNGVELRLVYPTREQDPWALIGIMSRNLVFAASFHSDLLRISLYVEPDARLRDDTFAELEYEDPALLERIQAVLNRVA